MEQLTPKASRTEVDFRVTVIKLTKKKTNQSQNSFGMQTDQTLVHHSDTSIKTPMMLGSQPNRTAVTKLLSNKRSNSDLNIYEETLVEDDSLQEQQHLIVNDIFGITNNATIVSNQKLKLFAIEKRNERLKVIRGHQTTQKKQQRLITYTCLDFEDDQQTPSAKLKFHCIKNQFQKSRRREINLSQSMSKLETPKSTSFERQLALHKTESQILIQNDKVKTKTITRKILPILQEISDVKTSYHTLTQKSNDKLQIAVKSYNKPPLYNKIQ